MSQSPDAYSDESFIKVAEDDEESSLMEIPREDDGSVLLSTLQGLFPDAAGLRYKSSSGGWRAIRISTDDVLDSPAAGWGETVYHVTKKKSEAAAVVVKKESKEKADVHVKDEAGKELTRAERNMLGDMIVLGLPFKCGDEELKDYFTNECGELSYSEVKYDRKTKKARGFGFIRFKTVEGAKLALNNEHQIMGREVEIKISKKKDTPMKLFVGRIPNGIKQEDLKKYFSDFGDISDVYIPTPFRGFGFITFESSEEGRLALRKDHAIKGTRLNLEAPKDDLRERERNERFPSPPRRFPSPPQRFPSPPRRFPSPPRRFPSPERRNDSHRLDSRPPPLPMGSPRATRGPRDFRDPVERNQRDRSPRNRNPRDRGVRDGGVRDRSPMDNRNIRDIAVVDQRGNRERDVRDRNLRGGRGGERAVKETRSPRDTRDLRDTRTQLGDPHRGNPDSDPRMMSREFNEQQRGGFGADYHEPRVNRDVGDQQRRNPGAVPDHRDAMNSRDMDQRMPMGNQSQYDGRHNDPRQNNSRHNESAQNDQMHKLQEIQKRMQMIGGSPAAQDLKNMLYQFLGSRN